MHWKYKIFSLQTGFALISTICIRWSCNFTQSSTIHVKKFHILLTYLRKCLKKIQFSHQSESNNYLWKSKDSLQCVKCIFSKHFRRLVNKIWKNFTCMVLLCVKLKLQRTTIVEMRAITVGRVNIWHFQCIFLKS